MEEHSKDIFSYLSTTNLTAAKDLICLLSNPNSINQMTNDCNQNEQLALSDKIDTAISEAMHAVGNASKEKDLYLDLFALTSGLMMENTQRFTITISTDDQETNCTKTEKKWDIQKQNEDNLEKYLMRNGYADWRYIMQQIYPIKEDDELKVKILKKILFFNWTTQRLKHIMGVIENEEERIRSDTKEDLAYNAFQKQINQLEERIENSPFYKDDINNAEKYANNILVRISNEEHKKEKIRKLYHHRNREGYFDVTENTLIEYILYKRAKAMEDKLAKDHYSCPTLVEYNPQKDKYIKGIIDNLPHIITLKNNKDDIPKLSAHIVAFIVVLSGPTSKGMNIHKHIMHLYDAPKSYSNIGTAVNALRNIIQELELQKGTDGDNYKKLVERYKEKNPIYKKYCNFCDDLKMYFQAQQYTPKAFTNAY